jgi:hypothetical protein
MFLSNWRGSFLTYFQKIQPLIASNMTSHAINVKKKMS